MNGLDAWLGNIGRHKYITYIKYCERKEKGRKKGKGEAGRKEGTKRRKELKRKVQIH